MHECPECGQDCDCDGEDTWNDIGSLDWLNCTHDCEGYGYDDEDDLTPDDDEEDDKSHSLECTCETCIQNHPERMTYLDDEEE